MKEFVVQTGTLGAEAFDTVVKDYARSLRIRNTIDKVKWLLKKGELKSAKAAGLIKMLKSSDIESQELAFIIINTKEDGRT